MKKKVRVCVSFGILLITVDLPASVGKPTPPPDDTTIRILLIADSRISIATINQAKNYLLGAWQGTNFSTNPKPTTITLANGGNPIFPPQPQSFFDGDADDQLDNVREFVELIHVPLIEPLRELHHADIVLGISSLIDNACGKAPQGTWTGVGPFFLGPNFHPDPIHDLREANGDYIGIAQISGQPQCVPSTLAHEFGHLLGGGHWYSAYGTDGGLLENSKSYRQYQVYPLHLPPRWVLTAMVDGPTINVGCPAGPADQCIYLESYSDYDNPASNRNAQTFKITARSVANYRSGVPEPVQPDTCSDGIDNDGDNLVDNADSQCNICGEELCPTPPNPPANCDATVRPVAMLGWVTQVCIPGTTATAYQIVWAHACPQEVIFYEIWTAQPVTNPFLFDWSVIPPATGAAVSGAPARIKVRSCGTGGCSSLSSSSFLAVDLC